MGDVVVRTCAFCGKAFDDPVHRPGPARAYCSQTCRTARYVSSDQYKARAAMRPKQKRGRKAKPRGTCLICGASLEGKRGDAETRYCSRECMGIGSRRNGVCTCKQCGAEFLPKVKGHNTFCSWACTKSWLKEHSAYKTPEPKVSTGGRGTQVSGVCPVCGAGFTFTRGRGRPRKYCSRECAVRAIGRRGSSVRRARKFHCGNCEPVSAFRVFERNGWICALCGDPVDRAAVWPDKLSASLDHIIPLSLGGEHVLTNVQCSHWGCNRAKGARGGV